MHSFDHTPAIMVNDGFTTILLHNDVDVNNVTFLREAILSAAENHASGEFRIDLTRVSYIDGAGVELLLGLRHIPAIKGRLVLVVASRSHPDRVLRLTRTDSFMTVISEP